MSNNKEILQALDPFISLFEALQDVLFFAKDNKMKLIYGNSATKEFLGCNDSSTLTIGDFFPNELATSIIEDDKRVLNGEEISDKRELLVNMTGELSWFLTNKRPLRNVSGEIIGILGFTREVTKAGHEVSGQGLNKVKDYIRVNLNKAMSMDELAAVCCLSKSQFHRNFKKEYKVSPLHYILTLRLMRSCHFLTKSSKNLVEISFDCGFESQSYFNLQFKKLMGLSPGAYRKLYNIKQ